MKWTNNNSNYKIAVQLKIYHMFLKNSLINKVFLVADKCTSGLGIRLTLNFQFSEKISKKGQYFCEGSFILPQDTMHTLWNG